MYLYEYLNASEARVGACSLKAIPTKGHKITKFDHHHDEQDPCKSPRRAHLGSLGNSSRWKHLHIRQ